MRPVELPKANENLTEATLERWLVQAGQRVSAGQPLCVIITDKAAFELPAPDSGVVLELLAPARAVLPVGFILCALGAEGETVAPAYAESNRELLVAHREGIAGLGDLTDVRKDADPGPGSGARAGGGVRATPAARRLAREAGLDLAAVAASLRLSRPLNENDLRSWIREQDKGSCRNK